MLGDYEDYSLWEWPTDPSGYALVQPPGSVQSTGPTGAASWSWLSSLFAPAASVANTYITQSALTARQQQQIAAGQVQVGQGSTIFGIPTILLVGAGALLLVTR